MIAPALRARLHALVSKPPIFVLARGLAQLGITSKFVQMRETMHFIKAGEPTRLENIFRHIFQDTPEIGFDPDHDLAHKSVMEIGCGRHGGLAPFAFRQNAEHYVGFDPLVREDILHSSRVLKLLESSYFAPVGAALANRFRANSRFLNSLSAIDEIAQNSLDMIMSISCLEHIGDLESAIAMHSEKLKPGGYHLHLVNFSNHLDKNSPFQWMYDAEPKVFQQSYPGIINLKRPSDVKAIFDGLGFETILIPRDIRHNAVAEDKLHPWWRERYPVEELAIRTAILLAVKK